MGMVKIVQPAGWDFDAPLAQSVKISSRGLVGADRSAFIKRAGDASAIFLPYLDSLKIAADEEPVHAIALGDYERYSLNRNGDGFEAAHCKKSHDTFVRFARCYRNHSNTNPAQSFGLIKLSAYNPVMHRIELLSVYNKTKEAAERNGGLVADRELEKLAKDGELGGSMACRIAFDQCNYCGHQAATRADYCTREKCAAGGCRDNLTRLVKVGSDIHHLGVLNPDPYFFDWSYVGRPAAHIAYGASADWLDKAASATFAGIGGAKLAEELGVIAPLAVVLAQDATGLYADETTRSHIKLAHALAKLETLLEPSPAVRAFTSAVQPPMDFQALDLEPCYPEKVAGALAALAERDIVMPLRDFARLTQETDLVASARPLLKGAYERMLGDNSLSARLRCCQERPVAAQTSLRQKSAAAAMVPQHALTHTAVTARVCLSALRSPGQHFENSCKIAAAPSAAAEELARRYATYKLAALHQIAGSADNFLLTAKLALHQNDA